MSILASDQIFHTPRPPRFSKLLMLGVQHQNLHGYIPACPCSKVTNFPYAMASEPVHTAILWRVWHQACSDFHLLNSKKAITSAMLTCYKGQYKKHLNLLTIKIANPGRQRQSVHDTCIVAIVAATSSLHQQQRN